MTSGFFGHNREHSENAKKAYIRKAYSAYHQSVNMSYTELKRWEQNPCSKKASLSRAPIKRNLNLLSKPFKKWTLRDAHDAMRTVRFNARMSKAKQGKHISRQCRISKRDISLRNWAKQV